MEKDIEQISKETNSGDKKKKFSRRTLIQQLGFSMDGSEDGLSVLLDEKHKIGNFEEEIIPDAGVVGTNKEDENIVGKKRKKKVSLSDLESLIPRKRRKVEEVPELPSFFTKEEKKQINQDQPKSGFENLSTEEELRRGKEEYEKIRQQQLSDQNAGVSGENEFIDPNVKIIDMTQRNLAQIEELRKHAKNEQFRKEIFNARRFRVLTQGSKVGQLKNQIIGLAKDAARKEMEYDEIRSAAASGKKKSWSQYGW